MTGEYPTTLLARGATSALARLEGNWKGMAMPSLPSPLASLSRRRLLQSAALAGVSLGSVTRPESSRGYLANDLLQVAAIGTGGRCQWLMQRLATIPNVRITAVCDVWDFHRAKGKELADPHAHEEIDYRRVLDRSDVDAVLVGTPDHWHVPITVDACGAGKDVYVEKPLTHDLSEGPRVIEAQNRNRRVVQVGTQQRSMPHLQECLEIIRAGELGEVFKIHMTWNRNQPRWERDRYAIDRASVNWKLFLGSAPQQPFDPYRFRNWRWFWDFGGGIFTDLMVHWIDTAHWLLDMGHPATAASLGNHFRATGLWETPDTVQTLLAYPDDHIQAYFEGTFVNHRNRAMMECMGSKATLYVDRGRYEVIPEHGGGVQPRQRIEGKGERGSDFFSEVDGELYHLQNWVECVRTRERPNCPAEEGVRAAAAAHLANLSLRRGEIARWNDAR